MTRSHRFLVLVFTLALLQLHVAMPAHATAAHHTASTAPPRTLTLTAAEINATFGSGFTKLTATGLSAMGSGMASLAIVKKAGYVTGYAMAFQRQHPSPLMVNTGVNLMRSKAFAQAAILRVFRTYDTPSGRKEGIHVTRTSVVGDSAVLFSFAAHESGRTFREFGYLFSRGPYDGEVLTIGISVPDASKILSLTKVLDSRIAHG